MAATGTETVAELLHARLLRQLEGIHTAWCAGGADASLLAGLGSSLRVARLGPRCHIKRW